MIPQAQARTRASTRPRLLQACVDAFRQPDLREKILFTFALLAVFRFVATVPIPNINSNALKDVFDSSSSASVLGFLNVFSGGALKRFSVAALGVYPYITASIIMQLLTPMIPRLQALSKEGEQGRNRIQLYTHYLTVPLAVFQGYANLQIVRNTTTRFGPAISHVGFTGGNLLPTLAMIASMVAGTLFLVWLGELITDHGIGNGVSLIIFAGIVAGLPSLLGSIGISGSTIGISRLALLVIVVLLLILAIVYFQEAERRVPVQYAKSVFRGGRMYRQSGQSFIPLKVNAAGMIPLLFAFSIVIFPGFIANFFRNSASGAIRTVASALQAAFDPRGGVYQLLVFILVMGFTFFYTMVIFQQQNLAENLQKQGGFIPGIRPGRPTNEYVTRVVTRITWAGAIFLGLVSVVPFLATRFTGGTQFQISATAFLIVVGVVIDTMKQLEAQLLMRNYEGFIR
ncbi:MAG: preprotein translocase subunit SecY [Dehalococcoidia bacterium]